MSIPSYSSLYKGIFSVSLLQTTGFRDAGFQPYLNTGTLLDIQTGAFVPGVHGGMVLNGGLSTTNAVIGREQMFKSTELFSYTVRAMQWYPKSSCLVFDTEYAQKKDRLMHFSGFTDMDEFDKRMIITTPAEVTAEDFFDQLKKMATYKIAHADEFMVDSPIVDLRTGKPLRMWIPTFVVYDSWSKMTSGHVQSTLDSKVLGSSDTNMIFMKDGMIKKMMLSQLPRLATTAGIYFMLSAHVGNKYELNPYAQTPKGLPNMKASDKLKEVGSDFNFLMSNNIEMRKVHGLLDPDKHCLYPSLGGSDAELCEVTSVMLRGKNNMSGTTLPLVVSQMGGIQSELSNYHYLRENGYFGLIGNKTTHKPAMTDVSISRNTVRQKVTDPKVAHAIELLAQLCYIQNNWVVPSTSEVDFLMKPEDLAEKLLGSDSPSMTDVLESRSTWTYDKTNTQPYLSLYDVLAIAQGVYKAKGIALSGFGVTKPVSSKKAA